MKFDLGPSAAARSLWGAFVFSAALLVLPGGAARAEHPPEQGVGPLPWRVAGDLGFTVDAAAFPDSVGDRLEVYLRLPPATLANLEREGADAILRVEVRLRSRFGAKQHEAALEFAIAPGDTSNGFGKVVMLPFPSRPGSYRMQVKLEDTKSQKKGIAYVGRKVRRSATVEGEVVVPDVEKGTRLSNVEFLWGSAKGLRSGAVDSTGLPNPERLYGLMETDLRTYIRATQTRPELKPWHWNLKVLDAQGHVVSEQDSTEDASRWLNRNVTLDLTTQPAGAYQVEVRAGPEGETPALRKASFSVAWQRAFWERNPREVEDEVHFLLESEDEEEKFVRLSPGEQEQYLDQFWRERDPTPLTAENENQRQYLERIAYANKMWTRPGVGKGMFSDMGRVYIRHGEPDEILRQVIPTGDQTLTQLAQQLEISEDRPTGAVTSKGLGGDTRPFEVWVYEVTRAQPITDKPEPGSDRRSMKRKLFLFVDDNGYGDYRLRYNTE
jgi:GWxTD domain-containing protein